MILPIVDQDRNHALVIAVLKAFRAELFFIHIPRVGMVVFGLTQPLLVQTTIEYIQNHSDKPISYGQTLIAAFAITYLGLSVRATIPNFGKLRDTELNTLFLHSDLHQMVRATHSPPHHPHTRRPHRHHLPEHADPPRRDR